MGIEIKDGKLKVSASYSLKIPAATDYSSEDAYMGLSLEFDVDGDATAIIAAAPALQKDLASQAKLAVFEQLGVEFNTAQDGLLTPKLKAKAAAPSRAPFGVPSSSENNPISRPPAGGYGPPKADVTLQPQVFMDLGNGPQAYYDLRSLKDSGVFKAGAADFRAVANSKDQAWVKFKDGNLNSKTTAALDAAGVAY